MLVDPQRIGTTVFRLLAALALLGGARIGSAAGTWMALPLPKQPGDSYLPWGVAVDRVGNLYVTDFGASYPSVASGRILVRDTRETWSLLAASGNAIGQVLNPQSLAVDSAGNLYVADSGNERVLKYSPDP
jgi:DNA-binding beta-propeller fold protein YncE